VSYRVIAGPAVLSKMPRGLLAIPHWPLREFYRTILEREGYGVSEAEGAIDLDLIADGPPDLVVVCTDDPRLKASAQVDERINHPRMRDHGTAFLALTTHEMQWPQVAEAGFSDCLTLPASIERIRAMLAGIAQRKARRGKQRSVPEAAA
jgi:DNA-binding response OmpR family regulator